MSDNSGLQEVKARKEHECSLCINPIEKGEVYFYGSHRIPVFGSAEEGEGMLIVKQTGVEYLKTKVCASCYGGDYLDFEFENF